MEKYKILCELIRKEQFDEEITEEEKNTAVSIFFNGRNNPEEILQYKKRMRVSPQKDCSYPNYYIPPYNGGKKLRLVQGYLPKTNILYANHYEAEILRLLVKFAPDHAIIKDMVCHTLKRFENSCFGNFCTQGECIVTGICVLRLLAASQPTDDMRIDKLLDPLGEIFLSFGTGQAALQRGIPLSYLLMAFTDINNEKTRKLIGQKKEWLVQLLRKGWITGKLSNGRISEGDTYNLLGKYIIRNAVCTLPEYSTKESYRIYIDDTDERCYCDIPSALSQSETW
ncbi:MAG: hypothetical protein K2O34_02160 [Acetatifactor sp.]|nr:hypothetical protein [Acetatifactor sp.]